MSKEIFISIANQKGGVGKSTLTTIIANLLHFEHGYTVAVVDCDSPQASTADLRDFEIKVIRNSPYFNELAAKHFKKYGKNAFQIIRSTAAEALDDAEDLLRNSDPRPDIVLFDLPGSLNTNGVITTLSQMDYIFTPMCADRLVVESTLQFVSLFNDNLITTGISKTKGLYLFWTGVDGRERTELYDVYEDIAEELNVPILKTRLADTKQYRKNIAETRKVVFRSTIFPMDKAHQKSSRIGELVNEICGIIKV